MKITFLGNFRVDYCSEVQYAKELESLNHTVIRLQEAVATTDQIFNEARSSDLFIWVKTHNWNTTGPITMQTVLRNLKQLKIPTVGYHLDLYMGLERWAEYEQSDYFKVEHFFTVDKLMADWLNKNTYTKGYYLPAGVFSKEVKKYNLPFTHQIVFTGSKKYHKEWPYRKELIDWLENTYGSMFEHYGNDGIRIVRGNNLNELYSSTKIVIGDSLNPNFDYPYYWSDRIYEVTGRGGFIIHPYIKGLERQFAIGKEIVTYDYGDYRQLKGLIDFYLNNDKPRELIRERGFKRTKKEHTYKSRWQHILKEIGL